MLDPDDLATAFGRNLRIIQMQTEGLSHADSLIQPPFRGNCLNWVLGHLLDNRQQIIEVLGGAPVPGVAELTPYERGSAPLAEGEQALPLEQLLAALATTQERIADHLAAATPDTFAAPVTFGERTTTLGKRLFFLYFHETYHIGQTELLRQLAGTDDQII